MKRYRVRLGRFALQDWEAAVQWGIDFWGVEEALRWLNDLESHVELRLSEMPSAYSITPETSEFGFDVRQIIYGRYRILFTLDTEEVLILRVRGPHTSSSEEW